MSWGLKATNNFYKYKSKRAMNSKKILNSTIIAILSSVFFCLILPEKSLSQTIELSGIIRDFQDSHPDFEREPNVDKNELNQVFKYGLDKNITTNLLGDDGKPTYAGTSYSTTNKNNFDQWYRDVPGINQRKTHNITLDYDQSQKKYIYENNSFFPIDNELFGNQGRSHNYHFTYEIKANFTYIGNETFTFIGDDDVWVYINGKKVLDIGGVHGAETASFTLNADKATELGLEEGNTYSFNFFFAERHTTKSHFRIETTIAFEEPSD
jgi:fibro-slime domain-containing protein